MSTPRPRSTYRLRTAPEVRFGSVDQAPWQNLPFYFSFEAFSDAAHRSDTVTDFSTPNFVERSEIAPTVTMPFHLGLVAERYPDLYLALHLLRRTNSEWLVRQSGFLPQHRRTFRGYSPAYTRPRLGICRIPARNGSTSSSRKLSTTTSTGSPISAASCASTKTKRSRNTNEFEYGVTQRLYRRKKDGTAEEIVSWKLAQKYFFNPTFGGALVIGQRNVFQTTDALTPFAFASQPYQFSPIVSDLRIEPGKHFDTQFIVNFDPRHGQLNAIGTLLKLKPYKESFFTLAHFSVVESADASAGQSSRFYLRAALQSGPRPHRLRRSHPPRLERHLRRQLRPHPASISKPGRRSQLQRLLLRRRRRLPQIFLRQHPQ